MNLTSAGGEFAEYSKDRFFRALRFLSAFTGTFVKNEAYYWVQNRYDHGRTGRIGCAGLAVTRIYCLLNWKKTHFPMCFASALMINCWPNTSVLSTTKAETKR